MPRQTDFSRQLRTIRRSLRAIERALRRLTPALKAARTSTNGSRPKRSPMTITPARRAQMRLQGAYIGSLKRLKPRDKTRVQKIRAVKGVRQAIAEARRLR